MPKLITRSNICDATTADRFACQIEITPRGWWVLTYPRVNVYALLILHTEAQRREFLKDCRVQSVSEITTTNAYWYLQAANRLP